RSEDGVTSNPVEAPAAGTPQLSPTACRYALPKSVEGSMFRCADLVVPEDRSKPGGRTVKLHVAIFKGKAAGAPTIDLAGGPGEPSETAAMGLAAGAKEIQDSFGKFLEHGDVVFLDQRGTGRSIPRLDCAAERLTQEQNGTSEVATLEMCRDRH